MSDGKTLAVRFQGQRDGGSIKQTGGREAGGRGPVANRLWPCSAFGGAKWVSRAP